MEYRISEKRQLSENYLKEYILNGKTFRIDELFLRHASLLIKGRNKKLIAPTESELLDNLNEANTQENEELEEIRGHHRYVFGVSHAELHRTSPNTTVITCGAGTMFSIGNPKSRTKHFQLINSSLERIHPKNSVLIFEFGEIDIRNHIFKISKKKSQCIYSVADSSISKYIELLKSIKNNGFNIMISGPHCGGGASPSRTSAIENNDLCAYINDALMLECRINGFYFFTLFDKVVNQKTLQEIPGLYKDHIHLCLPPSKIGYALNNLLNKRIYRALSQSKTKCQFFQQEDVKGKCRIVISDIPSWQTGEEFEPGQEINFNEECLKIGQQMLLIELPFLMHPKEVSLTFKKNTSEIRTAVQYILEPWDGPQKARTENIINAHSKPTLRASENNSINHSFTLQKISDQMSKLLIIRISANAHGNYLTKISIKRWIKQYQHEREYKLANC